MENQNYSPAEIMDTYQEGNRIRAEREFRNLPESKQAEVISIAKKERAENAIRFFNRILGNVVVFIL